MSLFRKIEEELMELLNLEKKRIASHEKIIKVYPEGSPAAIENKRLQNDALTAEASINRCLQKFGFIVRAYRNKVPPNYEESLRQILLELKQAKAYGNKLFEAEGLITRIYNEVERAVAGARV